MCECMFHVLWGEAEKGEEENFDSEIWRGKCGINKKGTEKLVQGTFCGKHTTTQNKLIFPRICYELHDEDGVSVENFSNLN